MKKIFKTLKRVLQVAWIGLVSDYESNSSKDFCDDGFEKQKVVYIAKPLMKDV